MSVSEQRALVVAREDVGWSVFSTSKLAEEREGGLAAHGGGQVGEEFSDLLLLGRRLARHPVVLPGRESLVVGKADLLENVRAGMGLEGADMRGEFHAERF